MIQSFKDKEAEKIYNREYSKKIPENIQRRAKRKLLLIDAASSLEDLRIPPGNRLEQPPGDRLGQHSIRINKQWRICFEWHEGDAYKVEIEDYH